MNVKADFMQVMYLDFCSSNSTHLRRGRKIYKESMPKQKKLNEKRAKRYFEALVEANFKTGRDLHITLTFAPEQYPKDEKEAKKAVQSWVMYLNRKRKRRGLENAKYIIVFEISKTGRFHFHVLMDGELDRDTVEKTWLKGTCNADRLRSDGREGLKRLIEYLAKGGENKEGENNRDKWNKRWIPSRGLIRPWISEGESKMSGRKFHKVVTYPEDSEELIRSIESDNKGYRVLSVEKSFNEQTGQWFMFCRMRRDRKNESKYRPEKMIYTPRIGENDDNQAGFTQI